RSAQAHTGLQVSAVATRVVLAHVSTPLAQQPALFAAPFALADGIALVGRLFTLAEPELHFHDAAVVEVELERYERVAGALGETHELCHLALLQENLALPKRLMIEPVRRRVLRDMRVEQIKLASILCCIRLANIAPALAQGLHFRAREHEPGLDLVLNEIVE